jgi:hypothetical protein
MPRKPRPMELNKTHGFTIKTTESFSDCWTHISKKVGVNKTHLVHLAMMNFLNIELDENGLYCLSEKGIKDVANRLGKPGR